MSPCQLLRSAYKPEKTSHHGTVAQGDPSAHGGDDADSVPSSCMGKQEPHPAYLLYVCGALTLCCLLAPLQSALGRHT